MHAAVGCNCWPNSKPNPHGFGGLKHFGFLPTIRANKIKATNKLKHFQRTGVNQQSRNENVYLKATKNAKFKALFSENKT